MQDQRLELLRPKMDRLFAMKEATSNRDFNSKIQAGREYRNPRICEKLIQNCGIKQYGSNFAKDQFDPSKWERKDLKKLAECRRSG